MDTWQCSFLILVPAVGARSPADSRRGALRRGRIGVGRFECGLWPAGGPRHRERPAAWPREGTRLGCDTARRARPVFGGAGLDHDAAETAAAVHGIPRLRRRLVHLSVSATSLDGSTGAGTYFAREHAAPGPRPCRPGLRQRQNPAPAGLSPAPPDAGGGQPASAIRPSSASKRGSPCSEARSGSLPIHAALPKPSAAHSSRQPIASSARPSRAYRQATL